MTRRSLAPLRIGALLVAIGLAWPGMVWAQKGGKKHGGEGPPGKHASQGPPEHRTVVRGDDHDGWRDHDRCHVVITQYYDRRGLPPGLAKKRSLPPGLQKQLRERGHLPPGLERHWVVLPVELVRELPPLPPHHVWRGVGEDLLVVDIRTNVVVSIMAGVFIGL